MHPSPNHLDGVASVDSLNNFFWVSLRGYLAPMENLHRGMYSGGNVSDTFSLPVVIHSNNGFVPEAATPSTDKQVYQGIMLNRSIIAM